MSNDTFRLFLGTLNQMFPKSCVSVCSHLEIWNILDFYRFINFLGQKYLPIINFQSFYVLIGYLYFFVWGLYI